MSGERAHGALGETMAEAVLGYMGWTVTEVHPLGAGGHVLDRAAKAPDGTEWLVEVKVWRDVHKVGTDTVKKAIGVAWDLRAAGEKRPLLLVLSHQLAGLYGDMLARALAEGVIAEVRVLSLVPLRP